MGRGDNYATNGGRGRTPIVKIPGRLLDDHEDDDPIDDDAIPAMYELVDLQEKARTHTDEAINALLEVCNWKPPEDSLNPAGGLSAKISAAKTLLEIGYGSMSGAKSAGAAKRGSPGGGLTVNLMQFGKMHDHPLEKLVTDIGGGIIENSEVMETE